MMVAEFCHSHGHDIVDRSMTKDFDPDRLPEDLGDILVYGSVPWMKAFASSRRFGAQISFYPKAFAASTWAPVFGRDSVNGNGQLVLASDVPEVLASGPHHLRPDMEDKAFAGAVYDMATWAALNIDPDVQVWASAPKKIYAEFRTWIIEGNVVDTTQYRKDGDNVRIHVEDNAIAGSVQGLVDVYSPHRNFVIDTANTDDGLQVLEFNSIHCSGFYAADIERVLSAWVTAAH
jgi:hypothetical protein